MIVGAAADRRAAPDMRAHDGPVSLGLRPAVDGRAWDAGR